MYFLPSRGGANKSNRLVVEHLASKGHEVHVVAPLKGQIQYRELADMPAYLTSLGARIIDRSDHLLTYEHRGVTVHGVERAQDLSRAVARELEAASTDFALVSNDDPGMMLLSAALRRARVLYLVHTLPQLPFGPRAFYPSESATAMIRRTAGIVSISRATHDYLEEYAGLPSEVIYPDVYSGVSLRDPDPAEQRYVTLVNACQYKGIDLFLAMADALPDVPFLAVEGWGTTDADRAALAARPNIEISPGGDDMDAIYGRTRVLVMPSLWDETFGYCCVEAMLRGVPVLAADVCGMRESKLGVDYVLPVRPIERYPEATSAVLPKGRVPEQDPRPWISTLRGLLSDDDRYQRLARQSRDAATAFVDSLEPDAIERLLIRLRDDVGVAATR
ncbi:glycosyltransferase family 4 protein [Actinoplanes sp. KI2]|uniref:glycosyltransferase family 4 protein n=1 Tax=Actinoplanes sp. KI2 TaxID=2983315 RepID=UPI0021D59A56|nr:glycosyltransferase family 4 protein [Actinoplanes sp. KI2]MCU7725987.1 glycosyltransferase family 4 protein [Actinoplanes sp. KI2]